MSYFVRPTSEYKRNLSVLGAYYKDMAKSISAATGHDMQTCLDYVQRVTAPEGRLHFHDPKLKYVGRNKHGDREVKITTFLKYLDTIEKNQLIVSPSLTVYQNPDVKRSITSEYIAENVKKRKVAKKEMFNAKAEGDTGLTAFKDNEQKTRKIKANALSGAHCSASTILYMHTIHSSLTSTCRTATGFGNANNEKILTGNRHYWAPEIVTANIASVINHVDMDALQRVVDRYNIALPTDPTPVMQCIDRGSEMYWRDKPRRDMIQRVVEGLTPLERAAFLYVGDLYHFSLYNDQITRELLTKLSYRPTQEIDNPKEWVNDLTEEMAALVSMICGDMMDGQTIGAFDSFDSKVQGLLGATAKNVTETLNEYRDLIQVLLVSDAVPASLASLPSIVRKAAVTSDTDSTIYTVKNWIEWHQGEINFKQESVNVGHAISFLASSSITHVLAVMSANIGVRESQLHQYAMKSEFYFPVFALTSRAKTYFAHIGAQEGQVYTETETELKGSVLHGSNSPQYIVDDAHALIEHVLDTVEQDKKIQIYPLLQHVATQERVILDSVLGGETVFYKQVEIKPPDSYKRSAEQSPYFNHMLWEEVFATKYGHVPDPPYAAIKVTLDCDTRMKMKAWLDSIEDATVLEKLKEFLRKSGKNDLGMILVPRPASDICGVPPEILAGVDVRSIISQIMEPHYVILESLGYYAIDDHNQRLISDRYPKLEVPSPVYPE